MGFFVALSSKNMESCYMHPLNCSHAPKLTLYIMIRSYDRIELKATFTLYVLGDLIRFASNLYQIKTHVFINLSFKSKHKKFEFLKSIQSPYFNNRFSSNWGQEIYICCDISSQIQQVLTFSHFVFVEGFFYFICRMWI